jgi:hypothetical protein
MKDKLVSSSSRFNPNDKGSDIPCMSLIASGRFAPHCWILLLLAGFMFKQTSRALIIAPAGFCEVSVLLTEPTRRHMPEDTNLPIHKILKALFKPCWNSAKWNFYIVLYSTYSFRPYHVPGDDTAPSENEYKEYFLGIKAAGAWG